MNSTPISQWPGCPIMGLPISVDLEFGMKVENPPHGPVWRPVSTLFDFYNQRADIKD